MKPVKTLEQWQESDKHNLGEFLQIGDEVDEEMAMYFIEVLPPACMSRKCVQLGEPSRHDAKTGRPMFETLQKEDGEWIYKGVALTPPWETCSYIG